MNIRHPNTFRRLAAALAVGALAAVPAASAVGDEAAVRALLARQLPNLQIDQVSATPYPDLYEVFAGGHLMYTDAQARYLIQGALIDLATRTNLSNDRLRQLTAVTFAELPLGNAIRIVKGDGSRRLAVFEDPDCPYCRLLEKELTKIDNLTLFVFLYPIEKLHRGATDKSRRIWCADDRAAAWQAAVLKGAVDDNPGTCETPLDEIAHFGRRVRINGTPTMFFADGNRVDGMIPAAQIERLLATAAGEAATTTPVTPPVR